MSDVPPTAWIFEVDPREIDLTDAFGDGEAVIQFEVDATHVDLVRPGQVAHLWVQDRDDDVVPPGIYATGSVVGAAGPSDDEQGGVVAVGFDSIRTPVDGAELLADDAFAGSALHDGEPAGNPIPLDVTQAAAVSDHDLEPGPLAGVLARSGDEEAIALPALEVRLPDDTFLVVEGVGHDGWTVVRGDAGMTEVAELPDQHRTFIDAVEYVATVVGRAGPSLPVIDPDETLEAVAVFDADGGVYAVLKEARESYTFAWVDDDGTLERLDRYATLKEAILLPVLDEELFGGM